jgi:hypothetical protein
MPLSPLKFRPGINRDQTNYSGEGGWWDCDKIRFRSGFPEKVGGWKKRSPEPFLGVCRQLWNWITSFSDNLLALGTSKKVYIEVGNQFFDITPIRVSFDTPDTDNSIGTTNGSTTITVTLTLHTASTGDYVVISGVTGDVGGVPDAEINGTHEITVVNANVFTFTVPTAATSTTTGGGTAITIGFQVSPGNAITTFGYGWGTSGWGEIPWGLGSTQPVLLPQRDWWFDNFSNDLVMNIRNGAIYWWERGSLINPDVALASPAVTLASLATTDGYDPDAVPAAAMQVLVSQQDRHLIAFGAVPFGSTNLADFDPMLIRWADQDNPTEWTPSPLNTAGFLRVSRGSRILRALPTRQEILVWTDSHLYTMQFLGTTDVFNLQEYADNISLIGPRATISANNVVYWMGRDKFYTYTGRVETLPCNIRDYVFKDLNFTQADQVIVGTNEQWNEIWWFYPSADSEFNNRYVIYNYEEQVWYFGNLCRTAWLEASTREFPTAVCGNLPLQAGFLYDQESGVDDNDAPMLSFIESNDFNLGNGDQFVLSRRILPDVGFDGSDINANGHPEIMMELKTRRFPGAPQESSPSDIRPVIRTAVDQFTEQVFIRARSRQMSIKISSQDLGVNWKLGTPRIDIRPDGSR